MKKFILIILLTSCYWAQALATINIVSAENFYGAVAKEIGGQNVNVINILNNPNQDPHLFTTRPSDAIAISAADIIVYNGLNYDPWMRSLLAVRNKKPQSIIVVADLMHFKNGDNPHIWYHPETMAKFAQRITALLQEKDPAHQKDYAKGYQDFMSQYKKLNVSIRALKQQFRGTKIIATEPVFNYLADQLGLIMLGNTFQNSVMNDLPPTISQIKEFQDVLQQHSARVLIFNNQVNNPLTRRFITIAKTANIPVIGISETLPANTNYVQWMLDQLHALQDALKAQHD